MNKPAANVVLSESDRIMLALSNLVGGASDPADLDCPYPDAEDDDIEYMEEIDRVDREGICLLPLDQLRSRPR